MKTAVFLMTMLLSVVAVPALEIHVAPVLYVDETNENRRDTGRVQVDLLTMFHAVQTGAALQFNRLKNNGINPPESLFDAVTVCRNEQIEYLLYGYVTRRAHNVVAEVRIFEYSSRTVMQSFFGMDDPSHYDRLLHDMTNKILQYVGEIFKLEIIEEKTEITRIALPAALGYWAPMDSGWNRAMLGTVTMGSGIVFIPSDNIWVIRGMPWYLSTGLDIKYRLGVGNPAQYKSSNNTLYFTMPLRLHITLTNLHEVFMGLGYTYFLEFFSIADKYSDREKHVYHNMGLHATFGYRFALNDTLSLFFRNDFDFLFNERSLITYAPVIGLNIQLYEKEIQKKW
jgi:hypothetical protein